jgi:hypothetical protein
MNHEAQDYGTCGWPRMKNPKVAITTEENAIAMWPKTLFLRNVLTTSDITAKPEESSSRPYRIFFLTDLTPPCYQTRRYSLGDWLAFHCSP